MAEPEATQLLREARKDLDLARNRLQACTVAAIAAGMHREQYEWGEWTDEASCAITRIDAHLSTTPDAVEAMRRKTVEEAAGVAKAEAERIAQLPRYGCPGAAAQYRTTAETARRIETAIRALIDPKEADCG